MYTRKILSLLFCFITLHVFTQNDNINFIVNDSETLIDSTFIETESSDSVKVKNLRFSIMGGPGYTPDFGFIVGGSALFTFSLDQKDKKLQRSVLPFAFGLTFAKPLGINIMVKPQIFFKEDKIRLMGTLVFKNTNDNYYGVGFKNNHTIERGPATEFTANSIQINPILLFKMRDSHFYIGPMLDFYNEKLKNPGEYVVTDPVYLSQGGNHEGIKMRSVGIGGIISYDTRDVAANAYEGKYFELKGTYYGKEFGSDLVFGNIQFDYRQYILLPSLGERRVFAWNISSKNAFGDIPFTRYPLIGNPFDLRGYYMGQYRNRSTLVALAEYRHMFNFGNDTKMTRLLSRFGFAAWAGAGMLGSNPIKYEKVLPNFGAGLRIELQPRMNFRLDIGRSPIDKQTLFYFNMTQAF